MEAYQNGRTNQFFSTQALAKDPIPSVAHSPPAPPISACFSSRAPTCRFQESCSPSKYTPALNSPTKLIKNPHFTLHYNKTHKKTAKSSLTGTSCPRAWQASVHDADRKIRLEQKLTGYGEPDDPCTNDDDVVLRMMGGSGRMDLRTFAFTKEIAFGGLRA